MGRQTSSALELGAVTEGVSRRFCNRLAFTTILAMAPLMGYGRQAYAACDPSPAPTFICSGDATANIATQAVTYDNADVTTVAGFGVNAAAGNGITVTGEGHLQFTDVNASSIAGPGNALDVRSTGDDAATNTPGAITISVNSALTGGVDGIHADNKGSGDINITADGAVTGTAGNGIYSLNSVSGGKLTITTGAASGITGGSNGILAANFGSGDTEVIANGDVSGTTKSGIYAFNYTTSGDLKVTTAAGTVVTGGYEGIRALNRGGDLEITANGDVTGSTGNGISGLNFASGENLKITAEKTVTGNINGIGAVNLGSGDIEVIANGAVTGETADGIYASNDDISGGLKITTGAQSSVTGSDDGIEVEHEGVGNLEITVNGKVTGEGNDGIYASSSNDGQFIITTGVQSVVTGAVNGIATDNHGYGSQEITVDGTVTGLGGNGISASNSSAGDNLKSLKITTGAASIVTGSENGIYANNFGDLDIEITADGVATGENANGIYSKNGGDSDTIIKVGASGLVQGDAAGINAVSFFGGQDIAITNDGLVRNLSGDTSDLAIKTTGGVSTVNNNNLLIGTVDLSEFGDTLNNGGLWNSANGFSEFHGGYDVVNNSGTLRAADDRAVSEETALSNLEAFNNSGLMTLVDGREGDTLEMGGATDYVGLNGKLAVDAFLDPAGAADRLVIAGNSSGTTTLVVNLTNPIGSAPSLDGIPVIAVTGNTAEGDFNLEGGVLNAGFFAWDLRLDGTTHELITTGLGAGSFEFAAGITAAQDIWYQTTGTLLQRQADLRSLLSGTQVTPVADFAELVAPTPAGHVTPGLWFKGLGAYLERDADEANNVVTDRKQTTFGFLGGFDFGTENLKDQGDALMFGLLGGYITSDLDFDSTNTEWQYEGPTVGAYATYLDDAFYADVIVKADFLDVDIDAGDIAPGAGDANTDVLNIGGLIDAGYKIGLDGGLFVEPQASLAVVHTEIDDIGDIFGGSVEFDDETSVRGRLGLRLGHELTASNQVIYSSDVTASVWEEFNGDNNATIFAPLFPATGVSDDPGETFGDVAVGFSAQSPEGWSGFLRANYQFAEDFEAITGNAGLRYSW